jgi:hypothetical protein
MFATTTIDIAVPAESKEGEILAMILAVLSMVYALGAGHPIPFLGYAIPKRLLLIAHVGDTATSRQIDLAPKPRSRDREIEDPGSGSRASLHHPRSQDPQFVVGGFHRPVSRSAVTHENLHITPTHCHAPRSTPQAHPTRS